MVQIVPRFLLAWMILTVEWASATSRLAIACVPMGRLLAKGVIPGYGVLATRTATGGDPAIPAMLLLANAALDIGELSARPI